jgi:hypothetical protein
MWWLAPEHETCAGPPTTGTLASAEATEVATDSPRYPPPFPDERMPPNAPQ